MFGYSDHHTLYYLICTMLTHAFLIVILCTLNKHKFDVYPGPVPSRKHWSLDHMCTSKGVKSVHMQWYICATHNSYQRFWYGIVAELGIKGEI